MVINHKITEYRIVFPYQIPMRIRLQTYYREILYLSNFEIISKMITITDKHNC